MPLEVTTLDTEVDSVQESLVLLAEVSTEVDLEDSTLLLNVIEVRLASLSAYDVPRLSAAILLDRSLHG